jgi:hypothetical protein
MWLELSKFEPSTTCNNCNYMNLTQKFVCEYATEQEIKCIFFMCIKYTKRTTEIIRNSKLQGYHWISYVDIMGDTVSSQEYIQKNHLQTYV